MEFDGRQRRDVRNPSEKQIQMESRSVPRAEKESPSEIERHGDDAHRREREKEAGTNSREHRAKPLRAGDGSHEVASEKTGDYSQTILKRSAVSVYKASLAQR